MRFLRIAFVLSFAYVSLSCATYRPTASQDLPPAEVEATFNQDAGPDFAPSDDVEPPQPDTLPTSSLQGQRRD